MTWLDYRISFNNAESSRAAGICSVYKIISSRFRLYSDDVRKTQILYEGNFPYKAFIDNSFTINNYCRTVNRIILVMVR